MISSLYIENILLIEKVNLNFKENLTAIIGETGSGKSIILECIGIAIGDRAKQSIIRNKEKQAVIIIEFQTNSAEIKAKFDEFGVPFDGIIAIKKIIHPTNPSRIFVNDAPTSVNFINQIRPFLIEIYSQFDHLQMINETNHTGIVDKFANNPESVLQTRKTYKEMFLASNVLQEKQTELEKYQAELDMINNLKHDIEELDMKDNEEEALFEKKKFASNYLKIKDRFVEIESIFTKADFGQSIYKIQKNLEKINQFSGHDVAKELEITEKFFEISNQSQTSIEKLRNQILKDDIDIDVIENRIFQIQQLSRKYNTHSSNLNNLLSQANETIEKIDKLKIEVKELEKIALEKKQNYKEKAIYLSKLRKENAGILEKKILEKMSNLKLENAQIKFEFSYIDPTENGIDKCLILISMNRGMQLQEIAKSASGGELSRFMLSLKAAISDRNSTQTLIFDEIDTGVGGEVAIRIAKELRLLSKSSQVFAITHNPQVAAFADNHVLVSKDHNNPQTQTNIKELTQEETEKQIAHIINGENIDEKAISSAREMIAKARVL